jgi:hypothetical protein
MSCVCISCSENCVPSSVTQGQKLEWTKTFCDYPADEWTLEYRFRGPGTGVNITAVADGTAFDATVSAVQSAALAVGKWKWQAVATEIADATNIQIVGQGDIEVLLGFVSSTAEVELRSDAQIALDTIDAALLAFATSDVVEYEIETPAGRRRVKRSDKNTLMSQRKYWAVIVGVEKTQQRLKNGGSLLRSIPIVVSE